MWMILGNTAYFYPDGKSYLVGLLNSKVIWFLLTGISDSVRGGFYRMFSQNLNRIPLPILNDVRKESLGMLSEQCQSLSEERYRIQNEFRRRLPDLGTAGQESNLSNKLKNWWMLDFNKFQQEIKRVIKATIPLAERNEWQNYFESEQAKIYELTQKLSEQEKHLDQEVYELFHLTEEEITLLEANI